MYLVVISEQNKCVNIFKNKAKQLESHKLIYEMAILICNKLSNCTDDVVHNLISSIKKITFICMYMMNFERLNIDNMV